jgi:hypothetical protein
MGRTRNLKGFKKMSDVSIDSDNWSAVVVLGDWTA